MQPLNITNAVDEAARTAILSQEIARYARDGFTVETQLQFQAVVWKVRRMSWFWNTILVMVTAGLWLMYVIYRVLNRKKDIVSISVDQFGVVSRS